MGRPGLPAYREGMATLARRQDAPSHRPVPWSPAAWRQVLYLTGSIPVLLAAPVLVAAGFLHPPKWALPILALVVVFLASPVLTAVQRHRLRTAAGVDIPPQQPWTKVGLIGYARSPATWRQLAYHLLAAPLLAVAALAALGAWLVGLIGTLLYVYAWTMPPHSLFGHGQTWPPAGYLPHRLNIPMDVYLTAAGIVLLACAPRLTATVGALDARVTRVLLGPSRAEELEHRVEHLTQTRTGAVDAADAERRRLERDLHDGTQQRLVALAMRLGMARAEPADAAEAHQVIAEAHEDAKAALAELRNLIRGLHPAVLADRGLDAALSGVTARMAIPVRLTVDLPRRPSPVIEAVAYFVVSESLTNITKHAQASQAEVVVQRAGDRLHIIVSDDGAGGANPARGTGLAGLAKRAASVDGTFEIASPPGGPTLITVDLPCAR
jgi:signal transduction histidine kinase